MENQNFLTNTPVKVQIEDELAKRRKQAKSRVKVSQAHSKGNIYLSKENGVCVLWCYLLSTTRLLTPRNMVQVCHLRQVSA